MGQFDKNQGWENEQAAAIGWLADSVSEAIQQLGNNGAATPMGAIEAHGVAIIEAATLISSALNDVAEAIRGR